MSICHTLTILRFALYILAKVRNIMSNRFYILRYLCCKKPTALFFLMHAPSYIAFKSSKLLLNLKRLVLQRIKNSCGLPTRFVVDKSASHTTLLKFLSVLTFSLTPTSFPLDANVVDHITMQRTHLVHINI